MAALSICWVVVEAAHHHHSLRQSLPIILISRSGFLPDMPWHHVPDLFFYNILVPTGVFCRALFSEYTMVAHNLFLHRTLRHCRFVSHMQGSFPLDLF